MNRLEIFEDSKIGIVIQLRNKTINHNQHLDYVIKQLA